MERDFGVAGGPQGDEDPGAQRGEAAGVQAFFSRHAEAYRQNPGHRSGADLFALIKALDPQPHHRLLDVATAAGHTGLTFAPRVGEVVGLDITPAMAEVFAREAKARGVQNARFVIGDVQALPFADRSFDLVTCRRAAHHFGDVAAAVAEMARVLRSGGRLGLVDMTPPANPQAAALFNSLERIRDASHVEALTPGRWAAIVERAGLELERLEVLVDPQPLEGWLYPVASEPGVLAQLEDRWQQDEVAVREQVVRQSPGGWVYIKRRVLLVAQKP